MNKLAIQNNGRFWWGHPRGDTCPILGLVRFANSTEKARLAIVPGYSHYNFVSATELAAIIDKYLADPLTNRPAGAAAASQAAPELTKGQLGSEVFSRGEADS